jgi:hypothetical protein
LASISPAAIAWSFFFLMFLTPTPLTFKVDAPVLVAPALKVNSCPATYAVIAGAKAIA